MQMPLYKFEFHEDLKSDIVSEIELADDATAQSEAVRTAKELMVDGILEGFDRSNWIIRIYNEKNPDMIVGVVLFSDFVIREI